MKLNIVTLEYLETHVSTAINYWCNACGDLHHHGEYDITEAELPDPLKRAYNELWGEDYGSLCYLVDTEEGYGIALINEYDRVTAEDCGVSMEALFGYAVADAMEVRASDLFDKTTVYVTEFSGFDECHELIVVFPADIDKDTFQKAADALYNEYAYKATKRAAAEGARSKKAAELIGAYVETGEECGLDDSQIIDELTAIFTPEELEGYGFGDFIRAYFNDEEG